MTTRPSSSPTVDAAALSKAKQIVDSRVSPKGKYEMLDQLWFNVSNVHPDGFAAQVLEEISRMQTEVIRKNNQ